MDLAPSYRIPLALIGFAIPLGFVQIWLGAVVGLFWAVPRPAGADSDPAIYRQRSGYLSGRKADSPFPLRPSGSIGKFFGRQCPFCFIFGKSTASTFCRLFSALLNSAAAWKSIARRLPPLL